MTLEGRFAACVFGRTMLSVILVALVIFTGNICPSKAAPSAAKSDASSPVSGNADAPAGSELPYVLKFEQGVTQFQDGDKITIHEIRGTAPTFEPGNIYWVHGMYTLGSHDHALLAAYTTGSDAAHGTTDSYSVQHVNIDKGTGTFTLFLPMLYGDWPHVSFYANGEGIGGNYFGTGDTVLKKWWGPNEVIDKTTASEHSASGDPKTANDAH